MSVAAPVSGAATDVSEGTTPYRRCLPHGHASSHAPLPDRRQRRPRLLERVVRRTSRGWPRYSGFETGAVEQGSSGARIPGLRMVERGSPPCRASRHAAPPRPARLQDPYSPESATWPDLAAVVDSPPSSVSKRVRRRTHRLRTPDENSVSRTQKADPELVLLSPRYPAYGVPQTAGRVAGRGTLVVRAGLCPCPEEGDAAWAQHLRRPGRHRRCSAPTGDDTEPALR